VDEANRRAEAGAALGRARSARKKASSAKKKAGSKSAKKKAAPKKAVKKKAAKKKPAPKKKAPARKKPASKKKPAPKKKAPAKKKPAPKKKAPAKKKPAPNKKAPAKKKAAPKKKAPTKKKATPKKAAAKRKAPAKKAAPQKKAPPKKPAASRPSRSSAAEQPPRKAPSPPRAKASTTRKTSGKTPETRPRKDVQDVAAQAKEGARKKASKPVLLDEDDLSPVRSSKTSGPLVRVTGSSTRPPADASRVGTPAILAPGESPPPPSAVHRGLPPEVQPDPSILRLDENRGALSAHGYRLILLHPESLIEIQMALEEKVGLEAGQMIFRGGYVIGLREARRMKDSELSEEEIVKNVAARCAAHGWGIFQVESLDLWRHELIFRVDHSPFAYAYGKSSTGVDHLIRGIFSGVCEVIFDKKVVATESMCRAMGDSYCQFMVG
jgi:predicted hydrocarbon binding protein